MFMRFSLLLILCLLLPGSAVADDGSPDDIEHAPLYLDGQYLFDVRGASAFPARKRARAILKRLIAAAEDHNFDPKTIEFDESGYGITLLGPGHRFMTVFDADARAEGLQTRVFADAIRRRIVSAIREYRQVRSPEGVRDAIKVAAIATVVFAVSMIAIVMLARVASRMFSRHLSGHVEVLERRSQNVFNLRDVLSALQGGVRWLFIILGLFALPWTRGFAVDAIAFVTDPLIEIGNGVLGAVPGIIALVVIVVIVRYLLKSLRAFFDRVRWGRIRLENFEAEWARPTERLIRIGVIAVAAVIAYPFIPGSGSDAFKGLSLFAGLVLSLGSSSIIANIIAGYSMIYRRAFQVGDRVSILDIVGEVEEMRILATHLRTPKNERVTFPNSLILNNQVVNYTMMAKEQGLILHT
ncbi:MAG TPA: mechanosensitive ion channel domain-containing protein, partial [Candidatus Paceibacterota bacterium]|nr:mechanosensitive ion channel domain-containing protein [Candidatus Paceibacterota bacterium]